ncbi:sulfatase-like hydrolase/transferase [Tamlana sp. 2_MG-2023]|uniref:sulfatase-like hydrolase/transferase n=1 Tax=unclassified Tamlana TaxID=2614803 RepID=UPI0026E26163|nr:MULTISPECIES: sulfatase-like hydrolase/transferase [unclassified Tamlana]MDO6760895.1 sulfatase-like hydrolase/transferase [Tamlana sp. 2_MG-2023]MDO6791151.1 sulfatase-like hydrolase/transferase [Tamlana sp. 1_MG-2023]
MVPKKLLLCLCFISFNYFTTLCQSPNIIFILTDDMGYSDVGFNNGATDIATPNLDNLANNGTVFSSAYAVHPFCGPSRAGLLTGRYPHEFGAQFNLNDNEYVLGVDANETFFSKILQNANYNTGLIGKWHLGQSSVHNPNARGFDYFYGMLTGGHNYWTNSTAGGGYGGAYNRPLIKNNGPANEPSNVYLTDLFTDEGVAFIENAEANDNDPFFLFMSYNAPHTPLTALDSDKTALTSSPYNYSYTDDSRHNYAAMVYSVDRGVKKLVDALNTNGEINNTLIVFMSDNGGRSDQGANNSPLRGNKGDTYEGGFRVPMFMYWPGNVPAGATYSYPVSALDLYPTFVDLAGASVPNGKQIDGKNIMPHVIAGTNPRSGESIYSIRHRTINNVGIRRDNLKAFTSGNGRWYLFDLDTNISENNAQDLSNNPAYQDILEEMINDAYQWSLTHTEPEFFDSPGAETTWYDNNSSNNPSNTTPWQDVTFDGYTTLSIEGIHINTSNHGYIYPNPVQNSELSVKFTSPISGDISIIVYDTQGRPIQINSNLSHNSTDKLKISLNSNISPGQYFLRVRSSEGMFSKGFIVN